MFVDFLAVEAAVEFGVFQRIDGIAPAVSAGLTEDGTAIGTTHQMTGALNADEPGGAGLYDQFATATDRATLDDETACVTLHGDQTAPVKEGIDQHGEQHNSADNGFGRDLSGRGCGWGSCDCFRGGRRVGQRLGRRRNRSERFTNGG